MRPTPLLYRVAALERYELNTEAMQKCAQMILGEHDFECFSKSDKDQADAICTVEHSEFRSEGQLIIYRIRANRFVRNMVRRLVGTMLQVGKGERTVEHFADLLHQPDEIKTSHGASAKGLILEKVEY
jgi:tRNA pseudouridine38-40 synthase